MIGLGNFILWTVIGTFAAFCLFILVLLARVMLRRNARSYPTPSASPRQTRHELIWTITPLMVGAVVAVPSLRLL
jgi:heme/copper-type cytochrome/quinol oxidase subunit 2